MNSSLKISVIIPVYNVEKFLKQCVDSVLNQTYKNIEVILVDDGSYDNCPKLCDNYAKKDSRIKVIHKQNGGLSSARNTGVKYVTGDYIMYVDSDDWIDNDTCENAIIKAIQTDSDVVIWPYIREYADNSLPKRIFDKNEIIFNEEDVKNKIHRRLFGLVNEELSSPENADSIVTVWGKLYRAELIKNNEIKFVDTKLIGTNEDALFNIEIFKNVKKAIFINKYFYHYRKDNVSSFTTLYKEKLFSQWQHLFDIMKEYIVKNQCDNMFDTALKNRICLSIIGLGLNIVNNKKELKKVHEIKKILGCSRYRQAYKQLSLKYFPIHWKIFFFFAKHNFATGVYMMLKCIQKLKGH